MIVVDSCVLAARSLTTALTRKAAAVQRKDPVWIVPGLWRYEFQNILATAIKTGQITPGRALHVWDTVAEAMAQNEAEPPVSLIVQLIAEYRITAYDAQYIALAHTLGILCVTEDRELQKKFPHLALSMDSFLTTAGGGRISEARRPYRARRSC